MTSGPPRDLAASVRAKLMQLARATGEEFQFVLTRYVIERFLYRLGESPYGRLFILKGAMLFPCWGMTSHRTTRDVDLLGRGESSLSRLQGMIRAVCLHAVPEDGLRFHAESVTASRIKPDQDYQGVRVECEVTLGKARIPLQIDIGFGDSVSPRAVQIRYPTLLDFPAPVVKAYRRETVIAEKFHALVHLGMANSRMKDLFDIWVLSREFEFDGRSLAKAIASTFRRRTTHLSGQTPVALTEEFADDPLKSQQWTAFLRRHHLQDPPLTLSQIVPELAQFLLPPSRAAGQATDFARSWTPPGPWR